MNFRKHLYTSLPEYILCTAVAISLCLCILDGFDWKEALQGHFITTTLPLCAGIAALGYCFSFNRKTIAAGVVTLCVFAVGGAMVLSAGKAVQYGLFYAIICITAVSTFLISRTHIGAAVLFVAGVLIISGSAFLEFGSRPVCLLVFLIAGGSLIISRLYRVSTLRVSTHVPEAAKLTTFALILCAFSVVLSAGIYLAVIAPLEPPTQEAKLVTEMKKLPLLEVMGVSSTVHIIDPERYSAIAEEETLISNEAEETQELNNSDIEGTQPQDDTSISVESPVEANTISYEFKLYFWLYIAAGAVVLLLITVASKLLHRRLRLTKLLKKNRQAQIVEMYSYFIELMVRCGLPPIAANTPLEYCDLVASRIAQFFPSHGEFQSMTFTFEQVCYGMETPDETEYNHFLSIYCTFPARCAHNVTIFKRMVLFFSS